MQNLGPEIEAHPWDAQDSCLWTKPRNRMLLSLTKGFPGRPVGVVKKQMCWGMGVQKGVNWTH